MFSKKNRKTADTGFIDKVSIIAEGVSLSGDLNAEGDIRIDGSVKGNVCCNAKIVITASGKVVGDIQSTQIDIHGSVKGNITARERIALKTQSILEGNISTEILEIEPNAIFNGACIMGKTQTPTQSVNAPYSSWEFSTAETLS